MTSFNVWTEIESPWLYGALVFATWVIVAGLVGMVSGESIAEAIDVSTVIGALAFAALIIYSKRRSNHA